jgi:hypothetical protein
MSIPGWFAVLIPLCVVVWLFVGAMALSDFSREARRDRFAAAALTGMLTSGLVAVELAARLSYDYAEAMEAERARRMGAK